MENNIKELINYSNKLKIIFIEDNDDVRIQLTKLLNNFFKYIDIEIDGFSALEKYNSFYKKNNKYYDLVITDLSLPKLDGIGLCKEIMNINPNQLILVISAHTESNKLIKLIDIGIYKFLQKPVDYNNLLNSLTLIITKIKREESYEKLENHINILTKDNEELSHQSITDKLTSLYNRRYIDQILLKKISLFELKSKIELSIIFIDIDDFKIINDIYGDLIGDKILIEFANVLKENIKENDILGRWGGEEFIIISDNTSLNSSILLSENIRKIIEKTKFNKIEKLTASFGIAEFKENDNISTLIQKADISLYKAKREGKNKVCTLNI
ncbi:MAG: diguanylate cyclase [Arcobacter sp.]|nr:diguanylate cyclase [Arcobacter sp.]